MSLDSVDSGQFLNKVNQVSDTGIDESSDTAGFKLATDSEKKQIADQLQHLETFIDAKVELGKIRDLTVKDDLKSHEVDGLIKYMDVLKRSHFQKELTALEFEWDKTPFTKDQYESRFQALQALTLEATKLGFNSEQDPNLQLITKLSDRLEADRILGQFDQSSLEDVGNSIKKVLSENNADEMNRIGDEYIKLKSRLGRSDQKTDLQAEVLKHYAAIRKIVQYDKIFSEFNSGFNNEIDNCRASIVSKYLEDSSSNLEDALEKLFEKMNGTIALRVLTAATSQTLQAEFMVLFDKQIGELYEIEPFTESSYTDRTIIKKDDGSFEVTGQFNFLKIERENNSMRPKQASIKLRFILDKDGQYQSFQIDDLSLVKGLSVEYKEVINGFSSQTLDSLGSEKLNGFAEGIKKALNDTRQLKVDLNREITELKLSV